MPEIPTYPKFSPIRPDLRGPFGALTTPFPRYSDFDFTSLLAWDVDGSAGASRIGENVVIRLPDYTSDAIVCSLLGNDDVESAVMRLLQDWERLTLVPEAVVQQISPTIRDGLSIVEDPDNHDYVFRVSDHVGFSGPDLKRQRRALRQFAAAYGADTKLIPIDLTDPRRRADITRIDVAWREQQPPSDEDLTREERALARLLDLAKDRPIVGFVAEIDRELAGFSLAEMVTHTEAVWHFEKTLKPYANLGAFLTSETSRALAARGCHTANWEQDLGIEGLRRYKQRHGPATFLKKFTVGPAEMAHPRMDEARLP